MKSIMMRLLFAALVLIVGIGETQANPIPVYEYVTVMFDANGGTVSKKSVWKRSDKTVGTLPTPKRDGYVFTGWYTKANGGVQVTSSTRIHELDYDWDDLKAVVYAHWSLNGVNIPAFWQTAHVLRGCCCDMSEMPIGVCEIKCGKANKTGIAKVSMNITPFAGKKRSYKGVSVNVLQGGSVEVEWPQQGYAVYIEEDGYFSGGDYYDSEYVWQAELGGNLNDGTHYFLVNEDANNVDELVHDAIESGRLRLHSCYCFGNIELWKPFYSDWDNFGGAQEFHVYGKKWDFGRIPSLKYKRINMDDYWEYVLDYSDSGKPNYPATKLSYNPKTGIFKGSFKLILDPIVCCEYHGQPTTLKKFTINVAGVVSYGEGYGIATCKKPFVATWPTYIW